MWNFKMVSSIPTSGSDWPNHNDLCGTGLFWFRAPKIRTRHNFPLKPFGPVWSLFSGLFGVGRSSGPKGDKKNRTRISRTVKVPPPSRDECGSWFCSGQVRRRRSRELQASSFGSEPDSVTLFTSVRLFLGSDGILRFWVQFHEV